MCEREIARDRVRERERERMRERERERERNVFLGNSQRGGLHYKQIIIII